MTFRDFKGVGNGIKTPFLYSPSTLQEHSHAVVLHRSTHACFLSSFPSSSSLIFFGGCSRSLDLCLLAFAELLEAVDMLTTGLEREV